MNESLSPESAPLDRVRLAAAVAGLETVSAIEILSERRGRGVYLVHGEDASLVVKLHRPASIDYLDFYGNELKALAQLQGMACPVPRCLAILPEQRALALEFVRGTHPGTDSSSLRRVFSALAQLYARVRPVDMGGGSLRREVGEAREAADLLRRYVGEDVRREAESAIRRIEGILEEAPLAAALGDFRPLNVLIRPPGDIVFIDLEYWGYAPRAYDLANYCVFSQLPPEEVLRQFEQTGVRAEDVPTLRELEGAIAAIALLYLALLCHDKMLYGISPADAERAATYVRAIATTSFGLEALGRTALRVLA